MAVSPYAAQIRVDVRREAGAVVVAVWDQSPKVPEVQHVELTLDVIDALPDDVEFGGWGLAIVERLAVRAGKIGTTNAPKMIEVNGAAIRQIRVLTGVGPARLAEQVGISRAYLVRIELGERRRLSPAVFARPSSALGLPDRRAIMAHPYGDGA